MNNFESHLRIVGLISPYLKLNLAYVGLFSLQWAHYSPDHVLHNNLRRAMNRFERAASTFTLQRFLSRPRRKEARHLNPQESDRLYRVARAVSQADEVLGSIEKARVWLKTPNRALGREIPLDLLDTEIGASQLEEVLLRLNYGIFS